LPCTVHNTVWSRGFSSCAFLRENTTTNTNTNNTNTNNNNNGNNNNNNKPRESEPPEVPPEDAKVISAKLKETEKLLQEYRNKELIAIAEQDNIRKRMQKEVDKAKEFGIEKLVKNLFGVVDTLNYCMQHKPNFDDSQYKDNQTAKSAFEALEATKTQFMQILEKTCEIVEVVPTIGEAFDPLKHNALFQVDMPNLPPGKIGLVFKSGFKRVNVFLRPADVGVVKPREVPPAAGTQGEDEDYEDIEDEGEEEEEEEDIDEKEEEKKKKK